MKEKLQGDLTPTATVCNGPHAIEISLWFLFFSFLLSSFACHSELLFLCVSHCTVNNLCLCLLIDDELGKSRGVCILFSTKGV